MDAGFTGLALFFAGIVVGAAQAIMHCADAEINTDRPRLWWMKALFRAKQRLEYKHFVERNSGKNFQNSDDSEYQISESE